MIDLTRLWVTAALALALSLSSAASATIEQTLEEQRQTHDTETRASNDERDWWLVSTTEYGAKQHRFYIDRNEMTSFEPQSRAWVDHVYAEQSKPIVTLSRDKALVLARCDARAPQLSFRSFVHYDPTGKPTSSPRDTSWTDVVPESSQQTLWRFICKSEPANAIVYVPDGPMSDAKRYYERVTRVPTQPVGKRPR